MAIIVGTAGFSYADWRGPFYPDGMPQSAMLEYYAGRFPAVELDYTYYRMPVARTMESMVRRTPDGFEFCVKAFRQMTHERPDDPGEVNGLFEQFVAALAPLRESAKLGCVLLQFPWSFKPTSDSAEYLRRCGGLLAEIPVAVEFRNAEWVRDALRPRLMTLLSGLGFGFCCVDEPRLAGLVPPIVDRAGEPCYVRFHGRNARKWWQHQTASERYDYLYDQSELQEWAQKIDRLASEAEKLYVFFNNCHAGQAATNAAQMMGLLSLADPVPADGFPDQDVDPTGHDKR